MTATVDTEYVHKSEKIAEIARDAGWNSRIIPDTTDIENIVWNVYMVRKPEAMKVVYHNNSFKSAEYILGGKKTFPTHKGQVVKILLGKPNLTRGLDGLTIHAQKQVPFDVDDVLPSRILDQLIGKKITWLNSLSTELESEHIDKARNKGSRYYRIIRTGDGRRYVEFTTGHGFRAVYLDAIVSAH